MVGESVSSQVRAAYAGFAAFGALWGAWGASVPAIREQAGLDNGQLGTALLFVAAGALPAMLVTGRAVDRWGRSVTAVLLLALGGAGIVVALTGRGMLGLSLGLAVLGAASGAADVAINAAAGAAERASGRPVVTRAHGVFSACVVVAGLGTGLLTGVGAPVVLPFVLVAAVAGAAAAAVSTSDRRPGPAPAAALGGRPRRGVPGRRRVLDRQLLLPLLVVGGLAAVAFAVENAHQSWSAVYLGDVLSAGPVLAAAGPAGFAAVAAVTRFLLGAVGTAHAAAVLLGGAAAAAAGTTVLATTGSVTVALLGLGVAAAGTAVLYPTLLSVGTAQVDEATRGAATSVIATLGYLGYLVGPVYVGRWAAASGLPGAMLAVAALAAGLAVLAWVALRTVVPAPDAGAVMDDGTASDRAETDPRTEHAAYRLFVRTATHDADPAATELAWADPDIRAFWSAQVRAVAADLRGQS